MKITNYKWFEFFRPLYNTFQILRFSIQHKYYIAMINETEQNFVIPGFYCSNETLDSDGDQKGIIRVMGEQAINKVPTGRWVLSDGKVKTERDIIENYTFLSQLNNKDKDQSKADKKKRLMAGFAPIVEKEEIIEAIKYDGTPYSHIHPYQPKPIVVGVGDTKFEETKQSGIYLAENEIVVNANSIFQKYLTPSIGEFENSIIEKYKTNIAENLKLNVSTTINYELKNIIKAVNFLSLNPTTIAETITNQLLGDGKFQHSLKNSIINLLIEENIPTVQESIVVVEEIPTQPQPIVEVVPDQPTPKVMAVTNTLPETEATKIAIKGKYQTVEEFQEEAKEKLKTIDGYLGNIL